MLLYARFRREILPAPRTRLGYRPLSRHRPRHATPDQVTSGKIKISAMTTHNLFLHAEYKIFRPDARACQAPSPGEPKNARVIGRQRTAPHFPNRSRTSRTMT
jgi:hypothetical protein